MISFGAPRVGNEDFKNWSDAKSNLAAWRYVFDYDTAARLPPQSLGFDHAGHTMQIWPGDYTSAYWRHIGNEDNGGQFGGAPWYWYCKYIMGMCTQIAQTLYCFLTKYASN